jgi:hypothetical protein
MGKSHRHEKMLATRRRKMNGRGPSKIGRLRAQIDNDVEDGAGEHGHQLGLRIGWSLEMETPHHRRQAGERDIVLAEIGQVSVGPVIGSDAGGLPPVQLHEPAAGIGKTAT